MDRFVVAVEGRPAPQGSKKIEGNGAMRESSPYLAAWRAAVKRDVYAAYLRDHIKPDELPLHRGPVAVSITFRLDPARRVDAAPDLDKLLRGVWDALTGARVWEDDGRAVRVTAEKRHAAEGEPTGADIEVWAL